MNTQKQFLKMTLTYQINLKYLIWILFILSPLHATSQTEFTTWGNITGIRVDNQLMEFNSSLVVVSDDFNERKTRKEGQRINFTRTEGHKIFTFEMENLRWLEDISTTGNGISTIDIEFSSEKDTLLNGAFFRIELPKEFGLDTKFDIKGPTSMSLRDITKPIDKAQYKSPVSSLSIASKNRKLEISLEKVTDISIRALDSIRPKVELNFRIAGGTIKADSIYRNSFSIAASGAIDKSPISLKLFPDQLGERFDGIGGNFRLQNPNLDPQVIDYSLKNLRVSWSRVEMPWHLWHPERNIDPTTAAKNGNLHPKVEAAMKMAQRLDKMGIPVILAAWFPPEWAINGTRSRGENPDGTRGNTLDQDKKSAIYKSITDYILYLKNTFGVETVMFSFNESDLGIDVRQTPEEHNILIKELGSYFRSRGVNTKFLLGDTADANGWEFTTKASLDPETRPYIGGVSFHSWRGWTIENLVKWSDISKRVGLPLFVGEGSIDAGAWRYPQIFEEPTYALDEIDVYLKILNVAQPLTILQWQLTADYSPMSGGGIFGNEKEDLYPTQRFFNLKQLGSTPDNVFSIPSKSDNDWITSAAFLNKQKSKIAIHLVNKGATRNITIEGIPNRIKRVKMYKTNTQKSYEHSETIPVVDGSITLSLEGASYISLIND